MELSSRAQVPEELGTILKCRWMAEISHEEVEVTVVVQVGPGRADGVSKAMARPVTGGVEGPRDIAEPPQAIVSPEHVRLQPVVGHEDVEVPVLVEIASRHPAPGPQFALLPPDLPEPAPALISE